MRQTESQAGHHPDCPEQAVLSFLKSVLHPGRERTAGVPSGLERATLLVLYYPLAYCLVPKLLPKLRLRRVWATPVCRSRATKLKKKKEKKLKNLMKFKHKASIYQWAPTKLKCRFHFPSKKPKHLCIYNTFLIVEETLESIHPVSRKSISPLSVGPNYKKSLFNWNHYYTFFF